MIYLINYFILILGMCIVTMKNPILAVISLILIYINTSIIFILLGAEFIGLVLIIIYVGAICILFLFVIMLLNSRVLELYTKFNIYMSILFFVLVILFLEIFLIYLFQLEVIPYYFMFYKEYDLWIALINWNLDIQIIGELLLNYYYGIIYLIMMILLLPLISVIALTSKIKK